MIKQYLLIYDTGHVYESNVKEEWFDTPSQLHERATQLLKEDCDIILSARLDERYEYEAKMVFKKIELE